jgi:hypothetical protein
MNFPTGNADTFDVPLVYGAFELIPTHDAALKCGTTCETTHDPGLTSDSPSSHWGLKHTVSIEYLTDTELVQA